MKFLLFILVIFSLSTQADKVNYSYQNLDTSLFQMIYSKYLKKQKKSKTEKIEYVPSFECNKKSLHENIDFYKKSFLAKRGDSAVIKEELGDDFERTVFLNPDVIITYRAYESYIKKCDDFSDFISKDEESPYRTQEVPSFAYGDLNYLLNVILRTQNLEAFKKLIAQGLQIDILFSTIDFTVPDPDDLNIVLPVMRCEDEIVASNMNFHLKRRSYTTPEFKEYLTKQGSIGYAISTSCY